MPGLSTRQSKTGMDSAKRRRKVSDRNQQRLLQTVRVIFADPDATDSSSDDDEQGTKGNKRWIREVGIFESSDRVKNAKLVTKNGVKSTSKYVGVRQKTLGRWVAEIRNPTSGVRKWLGSFKTEEEAHLVYQRAKLEFSDLIVPKRAKKLTATGSNLHSTCEEIPASRPRLSPSSVLDVVFNVASHGGDKNDSENGKKMKPDIRHRIQDLFSTSACGDGVEIIFDELKAEDFLRCNLGDLANLPDSSSLLDLDKEDFSWLDEVLSLCGFED